MLNTKGKYGKVRDAEIKWSIIRKSVMIIIFVEFVDQLIDYPINRISRTRYSFNAYMYPRSCQVDSDLFLSFGTGPFQTEDVSWFIIIIILFIRNSCTLCKQCRLQSYATFSGIWSGSTL